MKRLFLLFLLFISLESFSQVKLDSLWKVWNNHSLQDTTRMNAMQHICVSGYLYSKPDSAYYFSTLLYNLTIKVKSKDYQVMELNIQGASSSMQGDNARGIECFTSSLKISEELGNKKNIYKGQNNIG